MKNTLKIVKNVFDTLVFVVLIVSVLLLTFISFSPVKSLQLLRVMSGSMEPAIKTSAIILVKQIPVNQIAKGDIINFETSGTSVTHRVYEIKNTGSQLTFVTKGDANNIPDLDPVSPEQIKGKVIFSIPFLGNLYLWMKQPLGFLILIILPALFIIIGELINIKKLIEAAAIHKYELAKKSKEIKKDDKPGSTKKSIPIISLIFLLGLTLSFSHFTATNSYFSSGTVLANNTFSTGCWSLPSVPNLIYPADDVVADSAWLQNPVMDWQDSTSTCPTGFITYIYESYHDSGLTSLAYQSSPLSSSMIPAPGTPDGTYYWRVKAFDGTTYSDWSEVWLLTVNRTPLAPSLVSPTNNSVVKVHDFMFDWSDVTDLTAVTYDWEGSTVNDFSSGGMWNHYGLTASNVYSPGTPDNVYYWHVRVCDAASNCSPWTEVWKVTVDSTAPTSVITLPANNGNESIINDANWNGKIEGTATDNLSGVNHVDLSIHRASDNTYWNGLSWVLGSEATVRLTATGTTNWTYTLTSHSVSTTYTITSHSTDNAGNVEDSYILTVILSTPTPTTSPSAKITSSADQKYVSFVISNIGTFKSLSYQLTYNTSTVPQGIIGNTNITGDSYFSGDIPLATCSTGGTCDFSQGNKNFQLFVTLTDQNGNTIVITSSL